MDIDMGPLSGHTLDMSTPLPFFLPPSPTISRRGKARQGKAKQDGAGLGKARQGKARHRATQRTARQGGGVGIIGERKYPGSTHGSDRRTEVPTEVTDGSDRRQMTSGALFTKETEAIQRYRTLLDK